MRAQRRILIIDDDDVHRGTMRRYLLKDTAYSNVVRMAQTGEEGLSLFRQEPADMVLLDHNLPGLGGLDVLRALRETSSVPVILLTGDGDSDTAREALSLGAQDYLIKDDLTPTILSRAITNAITKARLLRDLEDSRRSAEAMAREAKAMADRFSQLADQSRRARAEAEEALRREAASRALLDVIFASAPVGIAVLDHDLRYLQINDTMLAMSCVSREAIIGKTISEVLPSMPEYILEDVRHVLATGEPVLNREYTLRLRGKAREPLHTLLSYYPIRMPGAERPAIGCIIADITDRKKAEDKLSFLAEASRTMSTSLDLDQTLEQLATLVVSFIGDVCGIDLVDEEGELRHVAVAHRDPTQTPCARAARDRYVFDLDGLGGAMEVLRTGKPLINPVLDQGYYDRLSDNPQTRAVVKSFGVRSNLLVPLLVRGRSIGVLSVGITTSDYRFSERDLPLMEELARRAAQAIENAQLYLKATTAVSLREKVLSVVSHDLRNPLNVVLMQSSILEQRMKRTPDPALDWLNKPLARITSGATRMRAMLEDLVDVARLQAGGQLTLNLEPIDLAALTRSVVEEFLSTSRGRRIQITSPASLMGVWDRSRIERVIANLVSNALKYSPKESVVDVELRVEPEAGPGAEAVLVVRDRGLGVPARDLPHLFAWFHRGANVQGRIEGTGVGLASVRLIIEQHRGSIAVESREGEGSTFTVRLPLEVPEAEAAAP